MRREISDFFTENKIEYFSAVSYEDTRETAPHIMRRSGFAPKSVIVFLIPYYVSKPKNLSVYAASLDYHLYIREISEKLISFMKKLYPRNNFAGYGDHSPIDERHAALIAGLGISGDNGLFINEKYGTYVFIADLITDVEPSELGASSHQIKECLHCGKCKKACPTGILSDNGTQCLSAITQRKGELTQEEAELMLSVGTVWGCDRCQEACLYNETAESTPIEFFLLDRVDELTFKYLQSLSDEQLRKRAFGWRGRAVVERNLKIFAGDIK